MKKDNLKNFIKGWICGDFNPTLFPSKDFEIAIKRYKQNDYENSHTHKISIEYTIIVTGEVLMNNKVYTEDDIIIIEPNEYTDFMCLTDVITCVIKIPSSKNDKYLKK